MENSSEFSHSAALELLLMDCGQHQMSSPESEKKTIGLLGCFILTGVTYTYIYLDTHKHAYQCIYIYSIYNIYIFIDIYVGKTYCG